jgi:phosphoribosylamine--glycine ligase
MRVLVVGSGAREHAFVTRLLSEPSPAEVIAAPGNPGIAQLARTVEVDMASPTALRELAERERADLTIIGPELPLSHGVADKFAAAGLRLFGPTAAAARLETSKAFAKAFMQRHGVPTARFHTTQSLDEAQRVVKSNEFGMPVVLKADGLAAGKGVVVAQSRDEADAAILAAMRDARFGDAGKTIVIEECLTGPEVSFFLMCDGVRAIPIGTAQDHKRIFDDDRGPNTGGMGAFAPSPLFDAARQARVMREVVDPVMRGMAAEGYPFRGFLYVGLMLTPEGPKVIEFNVRMGDPETQVVLPLIDEPFLPLLVAAADGRLEQSICRVGSDRIVGVVIASRGYPESSESGQPIDGIEAAQKIPGVSVYHAGTAMRDGRLVTAGGRVLTVAGRGSDFTEAIVRAYAALLRIHFDGMQFRRDIGRRALQSIQGPSPLRQSPPHQITTSPN